MKNDTDYKFEPHELIKTLRSLLGMGQVEFAKLIGLSQPTISKYEKKLLPLDFDAMVRFTRKVDMPLDIFRVGSIFKLPKEGEVKNPLIPKVFRFKPSISVPTIYFLLRFIDDELAGEEATPAKKTAGPFRSERLAAFFKSLKINPYFVVVSAYSINTEFLYELWKQFDFVESYFTKQREVPRIDWVKSVTHGFVKAGIKQNHHIQLRDWVEEDDGHLTIRTELVDENNHFQDERFVEFYKQCLAFEMETRSGMHCEVESDSIRNFSFRLHA